MEPELIAPCGINCALCSSYRAFIHKTPRIRGKISWCAGCRPRKKRCAFLVKQCDRLGMGKVEWCSECPDYPCENLRYLDEKYRIRFHVSPMGNLDEIRGDGVDLFLEREWERHRCGRCGGVISMHNGKCYACDEVTSWKG